MLQHFSTTIAWFLHQFRTLWTQLIVIVTTMWLGRMATFFFSNTCLLAHDFCPTSNWSRNDRFFTVTYKILIGGLETNSTRATMADCLAVMRSTGLQLVACSCANMDRFHSQHQVLEVCADPVSHLLTLLPLSLKCNLLKLTAFGSMVMLFAAESSCTFMVTFWNKSLLESLAWHEIAGTVARALCLYRVVAYAFTFMAFGNTFTSTTEHLSTFLITLGHWVGTFGSDGIGASLTTVACLNIFWIVLALECGRREWLAPKFLVVDSTLIIFDYSVVARGSTDKFGAPITLLVAYFCFYQQTCERFLLVSTITSHLHKLFTGSTESQMTCSNRAFVAQFANN